MEFTQDQSSTVREMNHDEATKKMTVKFNSGFTYEYLDINNEEYLSIVTDKSVGSKLRRVTKDKEYLKLPVYEKQ